MSETKENLNLDCVMCCDICGNKIENQQVFYDEEYESTFCCRCYQG